MLPSSLPVQITFTSRGEGASAVSEPAGATFTWLVYWPAVVGTSHVWRVRSPLMRLQRLPRSSVFHTAFEA